MKKEVSDICTDVVQLQARIYRLQRILIIVVACFLVACLMGAVQQVRQVTASELSIIDASGKTRIHLGLVNNEPKILFYDGKGNSQLIIGLNKQGGMIEMKNPETKGRITFDMKSEQPALKLYDSDGKLCGMFGVLEKKHGLFLYDKAERTRLSAMVANDEPAFVVQDSAGVPRAQFGIKAKMPAIRFWDQQQIERLVLEQLVDGSSLRINDPKGATRMNISSRNDNGKISLLNGSGIPLFEMTSAEKESIIQIKDATGKVTFRRRD